MQRTVFAFSAGIVVALVVVLQGTFPGRSGGRIARDAPLSTHAPAGAAPQRHQGGDTVAARLLRERERISGLYGAAAVAAATRVNALGRRALRALLLPPDERAAATKTDACGDALDVATAGIARPMDASFPL